MATTQLFLLLSLSLSSVFAAQDELNQLISDKERIVNELSSLALKAYNRRCPYNCSAVCAPASCGSPLPEGANCTNAYGTETIEVPCEQTCSDRRLNFKVSNIRTATEEMNAVISTEECWTRDLDEMFRNNYEYDSVHTQQSLRWQYIATTSGFFRLFPGQVIVDCHAYDPRIRPWYVAATSGPKDVVLIIDVSASMLNHGRLDLAKGAAATVIETLTSADFVAVVLFSDSADQLLIPGQEPNTLIRATYDNITALSKEVEGITAEGGTNFEAAFELAFGILGATGENSSGCHTAILFLTDGFPNKGKQSLKDITGLVRNRNDILKAVIFTYTLGTGLQAKLTDLTKDIACQSNGIYAHVNDGGNLREQLSQYYDYFASLRRAGDENVTWVEPYTDYAGAGLLVTASKPVYDFSSTPVRLIGVIAIDILVSDLQRAGGAVNESDYQDLIKRLADRRTCPRIDTSNVTLCELELIRESGRGQICVGTDLPEDCNRPLSPTCNGTSPENINYCNYAHSFYKNNPTAFLDEVCCSDSSQLLAACSGAISKVLAQPVLMLICFSVWVICNRNS